MSTVAIYLVRRSGANAWWQWDRIRNEELSGGKISDELAEALRDEHFDVAVSEVDRDPYGIMISKDEI